MKPGVGVAEVLRCPRSRRSGPAAGSPAACRRRGRTRCGCGRARTGAADRGSAGSACSPPARSVRPVPGRPPRSPGTTPLMSASVSYHTAGRAGAGSCCTPPPLARSRHRPADEPARRTAPTSSAPDRPRRPGWPSRLHGDGAEQDPSRVRSVGSVDDERPPDRRQPECGSTHRPRSGLVRRVTARRGRGLADRTTMCDGSVSRSRRTATDSQLPSKSLRASRRQPGEARRSSHPPPQRGRAQPRDSRDRLAVECPPSGR